MSLGTEEVVRLSLNAILYRLDTHLSEDLVPESCSSQGQNQVHLSSILALPVNRKTRYIKKFIC